MTKPRRCAILAGGRLIFGILILGGARISLAAEPPGPPLPTFTDVTEQAGIRFKHSYGDHNLSNIVEATGPGGALFDYDGDGYLDIYLVNGCWLREVNDNQGRDLRGKLFNALYHNNGDGTFTDVTEKAGVGDQGYSMGASAADYDGDGDLDLYVLNYGPNVLYRNNGDGTFTDVSAASGLADRSWSVSASWLDYDNDGDLDVYVANYLEYDEGKFRTFYAASGFPGPLSYKAQPDRLYRNNGDGTFTDVTKEAGVYFPDGRAMSCVAADLNNDGYTDIYVANDATPNCYWVNTGKGTFENQALEMGVAFGEGGQGASSMGPVVGDVDRDGRLDLYIPDMGYGALLLNKGKFFLDVTTPSNLALVCGQYTGWGGVLFDYDNDGYLDLFVANGDPHHEYPEDPVLVRNDGAGKFVDVARQSGPFFQEKYVSRGAACGDFDNDGDLDLLVMCLNGAPKLLRNDGGNRNNWLIVAPQLAPRSGEATPRPRSGAPAEATSRPAPGVGQAAASQPAGAKLEPRASKHPAEAIGARVTVTVGKLKMVQEICGAVGYLSHSDTRAHFGLSQATKADVVEIRWPNRQVTRMENVPANQVLEIVQERR
jgi:hypothetical protein